MRTRASVRWAMNSADSLDSPSTPPRRVQRSRSDEMHSEALVMSISDRARKRQIGRETGEAK